MTKQKITKEKKKYILTEKSIEFFGGKLFQIKALKDFGFIKKGELGGYIEKEEEYVKIAEARIKPFLGQKQLIL